MTIFPFNLKIGDSWRQVFRLQSVNQTTKIRTPIDLTGKRLTLKLIADNGSVLFSLDSNRPPAADFLSVETGAGGRFTAFIAAASTALLESGVYGQWELKLYETAGDVRTLASGKLGIENERFRSGSNRRKNRTRF